MQMVMSSQNPWYIQCHFVVYCSHGCTGHHFVLVGMYKQGGGFEWCIRRLVHKIGLSKLAGRIGSVCYRLGSRHSPRCSDKRQRRRHDEDHPECQVDSDNWPRVQLLRSLHHDHMVYPEHMDPDSNR